MLINSREIVGGGDMLYSRSLRQLHVNNSFPDVGKYRVIVALVSSWFPQAHLTGELKDLGLHKSSDHRHYLQSSGKARTTGPTSDWSMHESSESEG